MVFGGSAVEVGGVEGARGVELAEAAEGLGDPLADGRVRQAREDLADARAVDGARNGILWIFMRF